jgi:hypothetical protein
VRYWPLPDIRADIGALGLLGWRRIEAEEVVVIQSTTGRVGSPTSAAPFLHCPSFCNVRYGSKADIYAAIRHVRFTPNNDRENGIPHKVMSALRPKADMRGASKDVRLRPITDIGNYLDQNVAYTQQESAQTALSYVWLPELSLFASACSAATAWFIGCGEI